MNIYDFISYSNILHYCCILVLSVNVCFGLSLILYYFRFFILFVVCYSFGIPYFIHFGIYSIMVFILCILYIKISI